MIKKNSRAVDRDQRRNKVSKLVDKYRAISQAERHHYNEENTINGFIRPLFEALGWNWEDEAEVSAQQKAGKGRVDFAFRLKGVTRFYLEAKPLRSELDSNEAWIKQAVTYAYHNNIPYVVLTNFKSLWVFNGDISPRRFLTLSASQYSPDFEDLWMLSREATEKGLLEDYGAKHGAFPPKISVEKRLFNSLKEWRSKLFNDLHSHRKDLSLPDVDEVIQRLFNRLIFIRTAEDRRLEDSILRPLERQYRDRTLKGSLLDNLREVFVDFDNAYDSELFMFHVLDQVHAGSLLDDLLGNVIRGLYGPTGGMVEYDFSLIDADVLGRVYEQYLGHVYSIVQERHRQLQLRLERGFSPDQALEETIELIERRQRRKARGIYYTPQWVVDYIVKQTVGKFIQKHKRNADAIHGITVLDPACGSGSFLIRAYDELLEYHRGVRPPEWVFSDERLAILRKNIYGVDLDPQAVEIARLNLLLRTLRERQRLPELGNNIRRGNSLISGQPSDLKRWFGNDWEKKHPFDWEAAFPEIMSNGGFDVVIGNPPYIRIQSLPRDEADYFRDKYESAFGSFDIYVMFIEKGLSLLKPGGRLGFITSGKFLKAQYGQKLQKLLQREATVETIVDLSASRVFAEATTYPVMIILQKGASDRKLSYAPVDSGGTLVQNGQMKTGERIVVDQESLTNGIWPPPTGKAAKLMAKLEDASDPLGRLCQNVFTGLQTSADIVYHVTKLKDSADDVVMVYSKSLTKHLLIESTLVKPLLSGKHIQRYYGMPSDQLLLFPYTVSNGKAELVSVSEFQDRHPKAWAYLEQNRETLESREHAKMRHERWYAFGRTQNLGLHDSRKLAIPRLVHRLQAIYDHRGRYYLDNVDVGGLILGNATDGTYKYLLSLLNSKLLDWYFRQISVPFRGGFRSANRQYLEPLPIRRIDWSNDADKQMHNALVGKVERMLELQERIGPIRDVPTSERDDVRSQIEQVDRAIDNLVYELYGLTKGERKLVEESIQGS